MGLIAGRIIDALNRPLAGVTITTDPPGDTAVTEADGTFLLQNITPGLYMVRAEKNGASNSGYYTVLKNDTTSISMRVALWQLTWSDEFDGNSIDLSQWYVFEGPTGLSDIMHGFAADDVIVSDGTLRLRSQKRRHGTFDYSSAQVRSYFQQQYGRFEVRARLPRGKGIWPAHWLWKIDGARDQEIDIMESIGNPKVVYMTYHYPDGQGATSRKSLQHVGPDFSQDFHLFAVEWYPDEILWFIDGVQKFRTPTVGEQYPLNVWLDTYVGGNWPGSPDSTTLFPQYHDIDYVRVYQAAD